MSHFVRPLQTEHLQPLITRITLALSAADDTPDNIRSRIRILASASKRHDTLHFEIVAQETVKQQSVMV